MLAVSCVTVSFCANMLMVQDKANGTIVSSAYGFICGAYMPISQFSVGLQKAISFLPGTYGTSLIRNHAMRGAFAELTELGFPKRRWRASGTVSTVTCIFLTMP